MGRLLLDICGLIILQYASGALTNPRKNRTSDFRVVRLGLFSIIDMLQFVFFLLIVEKTKLHKFVGLNIL